MKPFFKKIFINEIKQITNPTLINFKIKYSRTKKQYYIKGKVDGSLYFDDIPSAQDYITCLFKCNRKKETEKNKPK